MLLYTCAVMHSSAATFAMCRVAAWQLLGMHQPDFQRPQNRIVGIASNSRHGWTQRLEMTQYQVRYLRNRKIPFNNKIKQTQMLTWALNNMYFVNILVVGFILIQVAQYSALDKTASILETTYLNAFSWINMSEFRFEFYTILFLRVQLTIGLHWLR